MHMFGICRRKAERKSTGPRYISSLQKDVGKYMGWNRSDVENDFQANKSVHTIVTIGYLQYENDILILTEKGRMLMQNVLISVS